MDGADVKLSQLFGDHDTLVVYSYMFGSERNVPCPMCTTLMSGFDQIRIRAVRLRWTPFWLLLDTVLAGRSTDLAPEPDVRIELISLR